MLAETQQEAVRSELDRILAGAAFRGSRRSQEFLRYIVCRALEGRADLLKERTIGVEITNPCPCMYQLNIRLSSGDHYDAGVSLLGDSWILAAGNFLPIG